jgi:hypothetical protein
MIRKRFDRQPLAHRAAQRIDLSDLGTQGWIRRNLAADRKRIHRIEFVIEIGVGQQRPLINFIPGQR